MLTTLTPELDSLSLPLVPLATPQPPRELRPPAARIHPRRRTEEATISLPPDQSLRIVTATGQTLLRIGWTSDGPLLELGQDDVALRLPGKLAIEAEGIDLAARSGPVRLISANDDVIARGEKIRLN